MSDMVASAQHSVVSDLVPVAGTPADVLDTARRAAAIAQLTGQQSGVLTRSSPLVPPPPSAAGAAAMDELIRQLRGAALATERVVRREFGTRLSPDPRVGGTPGGAAAPTSTLGPFLDAFNRPVLIDVFGIPQRIAIQRTGAAQPFLYVELPPPTGTGSELSLGPGSVWIPAAALAQGVPASAFIGLRIKAGMVSFGTTIAFGVSPIVVPAATLVTLDLTLDPAAPATGSGPGADARAAHVQTPARVAFTFAAAGGALSSADDAAVGAFGTELKLKREALPAHYDPVFGRVDFPYAADRPDFAIAVSHSTLATFAGAAAVFGAAWSLPISIADPGSLGAAGGAGGVAIGLASGLTVRSSGRDEAADCGACVLLVEPGLLAVGGLTARAANVAQPIELYPRATLRLTTPTAFPFRFSSEAIGQESWAFVPQLLATLDQPRTVNNARTRFAGPALVMLLQNAAQTLLIVEATEQPEQASIQSYCLKNLLLKGSGPLSLVAVALLSGNAVGNGLLALQFGLQLVLPILPDPYATNLAFNPRGAIDTGVIGALTVLTRWQAGMSPTIDVLLPAGALNGVAAAPASAAPAARSPASEVINALSQDGLALAQLQGLFDQTVPGGTAGPTLLDVSTNVSQFGVSFGTPSVTGAAQGGFDIAIADLFLQAPGFDVRVVTLPAVQWEPVLTPDLNSSQLSYANSGSPTTLAANSVTLVPIAPRPAIDALLAAYAATPPSAVAARFTLPFGIVAVAELHRSPVVVFPSPSLIEVQPSFSASGLKGGDQVSIRAGTSPVVRFGPPSLPGAAWQLHNARDSSGPTNNTVLTPIDDTFNGSFGPATASPLVPVTRIDISGFGESLFSDWRNPVDAAAIISKARFDVIVGRTSREIVQARSLLYPYGVRVVRTITIERQNGAAIVRHDSGWQAASDGVYVYPQPSLVTHPGVVREAVAVTNIRDTGQRHTTPDLSELMAVRFDCALTIENAVLGAGPDGVPARDQLGYVQLTDPPHNGQLAPDQYAELLDAVGPLGGAIDCTIDIGGTGQRMRVARVGVAHSAGIGGPQFVMAAWGSPVLPGGGQWSFLRQAASDPAPQAVDRDHGVPLVRFGQAPAAPPPTSPYCFADPDDLLQLDNPMADYGLVHATGTQRLLFPRPKLETSGPRAITSKRAPILADPFALATATGPFPPIAACIPFPNANYALNIAADGNFTLAPKPFTFTTPVLNRILQQSATVREIAYTADENNTPSVVTVTIDTGAADPWSVNITNLSLASECGSLGEVTRLVGTIDSTPATGTQLTDARFVFGPSLKPVAELVAVLEYFGPLPPPSVAMTNWDWSVQVGEVIDFQKLLERDPTIGQLIKKFVVDLDLKLQKVLHKAHVDFVMQFEATVKIPTPLSTVSADGELQGVVAIGLAKFQFQIANGYSFTFQIGGGVGWTDKWKAFELEFDVIGYYASSIFLITGDNNLFGIGASALLKGTVEFNFKFIPVEIEISAEMREAVLRVDCIANGRPATAVWGVIQATFALEVHLFWFIDIEFDVQREWTIPHDAGPCPLPDVV